MLQSIGEAATDRKTDHQQQEAAPTGGQGQDSILHPCPSLALSGASALRRKLELFPAPSITAATVSVTHQLQFPKEGKATAIVFSCQQSDVHDDLLFLPFWQFLIKKTWM